MRKEETLSYKSFIKELNKDLKSSTKTHQELNNHFKNYLNKFVTPFTLSKWHISLDLNLKKHQICILAHSSNPIRALAMIEIRPDITNLKYPNLRYIFRKISFKRLEEDQILLEPVSKSHHDLYTEKRGFWCVLETEKPLPCIDIYNLSSANRTVLFKLYCEYIYGMENYPEDSSLIITRAEQFDIKNYPTPAWTRSSEKHKKSKIEELQSRKKQKIIHDNANAPPPPPKHKPEEEEEDFPILEIEPFDKAVNPEPIPEVKATTIDPDKFLETFRRYELEEAANILMEMPIDSILI